MSTFVPPVATLSEAWLRTLDLVAATHGRLVHVVTTITEPGAEDDRIRAAIDAVLHGGTGRRARQSVDTVAGTIFPSDLYRAVPYAWDPGLGEAEAAELDAAAADLYADYEDMLPLLLTADGNHSGTYFSRMITWPGKEPNGVNQLAERIRYLRGHRARGVTANNAADIALGGEADMERDIGVEVYSPTDRRQRGFPCLVHIDLTLLDGRLSMLAVYRHQFLVTKAYGNLVGLSSLLRFLAQQTGYAVGELVIHATLADDERGSFGGGRGIAALVAAARGREAVA